MNLRTHIFAVGVFLAVFGFITHPVHSQTIPGGTMILGPVSTVDPGDTYPTHWAEFGKGGWRSAGNWTELNAIPADRIENGMSVWQVDSNRWFIRISGAWTAFEPSGTLETIADLTNSIPSAGFVVKQVLGFETPGDWGSPRDFWWDATNTLTASPIRLASALTPTGRWINGWNDGDIRAFGAKGDDSTDNTDAVNAALLAMVETGTPLYTPSGTYRMGKITLPGSSSQQVKLRGDKPFGSKQSYEGRTIWMLKDGANDSLLVAPTGVPLDVEGMMFDGNKANNSTTNALIRLEGTGYDETRFRNVGVFNSPSHGMFITRDETRLETVYVYYCVGHGLSYSNTTDHQLDYVLPGYNGGDGIHGELWYYSRLSEIDSFNNAGHGIFIDSGSIDTRWSKVQSQDNWKSGARISVWQARFSECNIFRNNIDTNYFGANPYPSGTYSEIEVFGTSQPLAIIGGMLGEYSIRSKYPKYLIDDQRPLSYLQGGFGISMFGCYARTGLGFAVARWPDQIERNSIIVGTYDTDTGDKRNNIPRRETRLTTGLYPYQVQPDDGVLILTGVNRSIVMPSTNLVADAWSVVVIDASGDAETNQISVSAVDAFVYGTTTNRIYDRSSIRTYVKSGNNFGVESASIPETFLSGDMGYHWGTRGGPRLYVTSSEDTNPGGIPLWFSGYRTNSSIFNMLTFYGAEGTAGSPTGLSSNSAIGGLQFIAKLFDSGDSGAMVRMFAVPDQDPYSTNQAGSLVISVTSPNGGGTKYTRISSRGALSIRQDGSAEGAGPSLILDMAGTNGVVGLPALTTAQLNALSPQPRNGAFAFDSTLQSPVVMSNGTWISFSGGGSGSIIAINGTNTTGITNSAQIIWNVASGIGTASLADDITITTLRVSDLVVSNSVPVTAGGSGLSNVVANAFLVGRGTNPLSALQPVAKGIAGWNDSGAATNLATGVGVTNSGGVISVNIAAGTTNVSISTSTNGQILISVSGTSSSGGADVSGSGTSSNATSFELGTFPVVNNQSLTLDLLVSGSGPTNSFAGRMLAKAVHRYGTTTIVTNPPTIHNSSGFSDAWLSLTGSNLVLNARGSTSELYTWSYKGSTLVQTNGDTNQSGLFGVSKTGLLAAYDFTNNLDSHTAGPFNLSESNSPTYLAGIGTAIAASTSFWAQAGITTNFMTNSASSFTVAFRWKMNTSASGSWVLWSHAGRMGYRWIASSNAARVAQLSTSATTIPNVTNVYSVVILSYDATTNRVVWDNGTNFVSQGAYETSTGPLLVGTDSSSGAYARGASFDWVYIWKRALTTNEIAKLNTLTTDNALVYPNLDP